jgi:hypothetical protein
MRQLKKFAVVVWVRKTDAFKATVLGVSAKAITVALQDFARDGIQFMGV